LLPLKVERNTISISLQQTYKPELGMSREARNEGVKTPEGIKIHDAAARKAISYEDKRDATKDKQEAKRFDNLRIEALNEGLRKALALNPKPRPVKKTRISVSLKRKRTSLSVSSSWKRRI
jgi:hypothetical protein